MVFVCAYFSSSGRALPPPSLPRQRPVGSRRHAAGQPPTPSLVGEEHPGVAQYDVLVQVEESQMKGLYEPSELGLEALGRNKGLCQEPTHGKRAMQEPTQDGVEPLQGQSYDKSCASGPRHVESGQCRHSSACRSDMGPTGGEKLGFELQKSTTAVGSHVLNEQWSYKLERQCGDVALKCVDRANSFCRGVRLVRPLLRMRKEDLVQVLAC